MANQKGITPIITVILLLLIAVVMVGFAFGFFSNIFTTTTTETSSALNTTVSIYGKQIRIDNINGTTTDVRTVTLRAVGSRAVSPGDVRIYNSAGTDITNTAIITCPSGTISPGATGVCATTASGCTAQTSLRAVAPGNTDTRVCP